MSVQSLDVLNFPLHGSRLIEASAGTGKTFTIALLYVRLVLDHGGEQAFGRPLAPPEILVVTFTEAATAELRERIRARLGEAARCFAEEPGEHEGVLLCLREEYPAERWPACARLLRLAGEWMDEAAVSTIHSWCYRMLREHAFDSGSLFDQELVSDQRELLEESVRDYWRRHFYPLAAGPADAVRQCFAGPQALAAQLQPLLAREAEGFLHAGQPLSAPEDLQALLAQSGEALVRLQTAEQAARDAWLASRVEIEALLTELRPQLNGNSYRGKDDDATFAAWLQALAAWAEGGPAPDNLARFGQTRLRVKAKTQVPQHPALQALDAYLELQDERPQIAPQLLLHALDEVRERLEAEQRRRAELGFDDLLVRLDRALQGPSGERLAEQIRRQYPVALIDEFQDTDPRQYRIFERLYRIAENPRELALLLIGDPKQAIYAFRGADIHTYLRARAATAGRHYTLAKNFRSTEAMVAAANRCFRYAEGHARGAFRFASEAGNPVPFVEVGAQGRKETLWLDGAPADALTFWWLDHDGEVCGAGVYRREMAARAASALCGWLQGADAGRSGFRDEQDAWRPLRPADIAILVRGRSEAEAMREELARRGLASVYLSDRDSLFDSAEARDVLHWLRACADPGDDRLLRAALATASLDLPWATLEQLNTDERFWEDCVLRFRDYREQWQRQGVLPMLHRLLADHALPARLLASDGGERRLTNLLHLAEWLQRAAVELDGEHALLRALAERLENPSGEEVLRLESDADLIKVVTIHKSKGLEYPLVLLPFACSWREQDVRGEPAGYQDGDGRVVELARDKEGAGPALERANDERLGEDMRLLYVALTRARHATWLGVAPLVAGNARKPELHKGGVGYLLGGGAALAHEDIPARLAELAEGCPAIRITAAPEVQEQRYLPPPPGALGEARAPGRRVAEHWWIASYSALAVPSGEWSDGAPEEPDSAAAERLGEDSRAADDSPLLVRPRAGSLHAFPRGSAPGSFLHGLLEWAADEGFASLAADPERLRDQVARRCQLRDWEAWIEPLCDWLQGLLSCGFALPGATPLRLAELSGWRKEMEFWFATQRTDLGRLDRLVRQHTLGGVARPALQNTRLNGMLKGFIDLVVEHDGRYYVIDYKSNWLGADEAAYSTPAIRAALLEHRYDLQYALYLFALHRLLRVRLPDYDYERHVGGAIYLFLRGYRADSQGLFHEKPPLALMEALDALFRGQAEEGAA